ncbi:MAG: TonB-dependent receptor, partial [Myxococcota bacterium]
VVLIDDILATRLSLMYERRDGWVDNTFIEEENALGGFQDVAGRFQILFTPGRSFRALLNFHAHSLDGTARIFRANIIESGTADFVDGFRRDQVAHDGANDQRLSQYGFVADLQYDMGPLTITSITGYETIDLLSRGDIDGGFGDSMAPESGPGVIPFDSESADGIPSHFQLTEEFRIASNDWKTFNFQAGFFYFREELTIDSLSFDTLNGGVQDGFAQQEQSTEAWALFASSTVDITSGLRASAGVRYSNDQKNFTARRTLSPIGGGELAPVSENPSADFVSWDASLRYKIVDDTNVYARVATGFRAPSIQGRVLFGDIVSVADSEDILTVESGIKSEFLDNRIRINIGGYFYQLNNQQLTAVGGENNTNTLINADKTMGAGFELDADFMPIPNLFISLGLSFNQTSIEDEALEIEPCSAALCTVLDPEGQTANTVLISGNPLPHAPKWIGNLAVRYDLSVDAVNRFFVFTNWSFRSKVNFFLYESEEFTDDFMLLGDIRFGYARGRRFQAALFLSNVLDDNSRTGGIDFNNLTGFTNEPRIWGAELRWLW